MSDEPIIAQFVPYQRWFGLALLGFGVYYLLDRVAAELVVRFWPDLHHVYMQIKYMIPTAVVAFIMILIGLRLAFGSKPSTRTQPPPRLNRHDHEGDL